MNQWSLYTMTIGLFLSIPLVAILVYLLQGYGDMWQHIVDYFLLDYVLNSVYLLIGTGLLSLLFGVTTAWIVTHYSFRYKKIIKWMLFLPLAIPSYIVAYAYVGLLGNGGTFIRLLQDMGFSIQKLEMMNIYGLIWILSCSLYPYVYASSMAMFSSMPKSIREASDALGVSKWKYRLTVALPLASPAIIGGMFLVYMEVLNDYGAAKYYGVQTFTTGIFRSWTMLEDLQSAVYLSALLVVLVFGITMLVKWQRGNRSYAVSGRAATQEPIASHTLDGYKRVLLYSLLGLPILFGLILPIGQLLYWAFLTYKEMFNLDLLSIAVQSVVLALVATSFVILAALSLIYFFRWNHLRELSFFKRLATVGYVIPGAIIGIGIIRSSKVCIDFFDTYLGMEIGFLFFGSSVVLVYAYVFRFLAVAYNPIEANSLKIGKHIYEASYMLKAGKLKTFWKVELPLLKTALTNASLLVFIDILKELPLTLILKPYNLQTLAVKTYEYADDERVAEAATPALVLVLLIVMLMTTLNYYKNMSTRHTNLKTI